jgi:hypothetical protein
LTASPSQVASSSTSTNVSNRGPSSSSSFLSRSPF